MHVRHVCFLLLWLVGVPLTPTASLLPLASCLALPDTFALVPKKYSDAYFELDKKVEIMCLGGPDFDRRKCDKKHLTEEYGLSVREAAGVLKKCCRTEFSGISEVLLSSQFNQNKIMAYYGNFFVVIVREYEPTKWCFSLGSDLGLFSRNFKSNDILADPLVQKAANIPSMAFLVGCWQMFESSTCSVQSKTVHIKTELGEAAYSVFSSFDCDDIEGQSWGESATARRYASLT